MSHFFGSEKNFSARKLRRFSTVTLFSPGKVQPEAVKRSFKAGKVLNRLSFLRVSRNHMRDGTSTRTLSISAAKMTGSLAVDVEGTEDRARWVGVREEGETWVGASEEGEVDVGEGSEVDVRIDDDPGK